MTCQNTYDYPHNITVIDTHYYREKLAASHLVIQKGKAAFVDVGTTPALKYLLEALSLKKLTPEDVEYIILTHIHLDHAGGAGILMQHCPNATLVVHPKGARHMVNPDKLVSATIDIYGEETFKELYREIIPIPAERVIIAEDGHILDFHGRELHFLDTPGHARHHCCIWDPSSSGVFTGDTMGLAYPSLQEEGKPPFLIPTTSPVAFDPAALKDSILRIQQLKPRSFYLTHFGPIVADPLAVESLLEMIDAHAELGITVSEAGDTELSSHLFTLYHDAYCKYKGAAVSKEKLHATLAGDIELNSQGLLIWAERERKAGLRR